MRTVLVLVASILITLSSSPSTARPFQNNECNVTMPCDFSGSQMPRRANSYRSAMASIDADRGQVVGGRPAGCPRSFCGCGASLRVFGRIVPGLNLAANWLRFPRAAPAPGMVAARRGHVFVLERHIEGDTWMAYDANSGRHATRIHARSIRGYTIVSPRTA
jgi:hypothetical protein